MYPHRSIGRVVAASGVLAVVGLSACSSSSKSSSSSVTAGASPTTAAPASTTDPGTSFSTANVSGLGTVVVDARGYTVYVLSADGKTSIPCTDASGCTKVWPDLSLPDGTPKATAGTGLNASLLGTTQANGETYPTYHGWLMYEFAGDKAPGDGHGQGLKSFGGTWHALNADGTIVTATGGTTATTVSSSGY